MCSRVNRTEEHRVNTKFIRNSTDPNVCDPCYRSVEREAPFQVLRLATVIPKSNNRPQIEFPRDGDVNRKMHSNDIEKGLC